MIVIITTAHRDTSDTLCTIHQRCPLWYNIYEATFIAYRWYGDTTWRLCLYSCSIIKTYESVTANHDQFSMDIIIISTAFYMQTITGFTKWSVDRVVSASNQISIGFNDRCVHQSISFNIGATFRSIDVTERMWEITSVLRAAYLRCINHESHQATVNDMSITLFPISKTVVCASQFTY